MLAGQQVGKYLVKNKLGAGGMADVYLAEDTALNRQVALKVLPPEFARNPERSLRFEKEVLHSASLNHPGIITIHDVGHESDYYYYAMSLLPGGDLKEKIKAGLSPRLAVDYLVQIAAALGYAHQKGIVHRDMKPENILFDDQQKPVITDFGIARAIGSGTRMTSAGMSIGTPLYMSPEQAKGKTVDARSDLYGLGVLFFEMLTGTVPYYAEDNLAVSYSHVNDPLPQLRAGFEKFQPIIDRLMAKVPEERFQSAEELVKALASLEDDVPVAEIVRTQVLRAHQEEPSRPLVRNYRVVWGLLLLFCVGGVVVFFSQRQTNDPPNPAVPPAHNTTANTSVAKTVDQAPLQNTTAEESQTLPVLKVAEEEPAPSEVLRENQPPLDPKSIRIDDRPAKSADGAVAEKRPQAVVEPGENKKSKETLASGSKVAQPVKQKEEQFYEEPKKDELQVTIQALMDDGKRALDKKKRQQAEAAFKKVLSLMPTHHQALDGLKRAASIITRSDSFRELLSNGGQGPAMVVVPAGSFLMGDNIGDGDRAEGPVHKVNVPRAFAIGVYEVTFDEYERFCSANSLPSPSDNNYGRGQRPVINVSWEDATAYAQWLSRQTGHRYRLPSESEWEYVARAGTTSRFWWGDSVSKNLANCNDCRSSWSGRGTAPVGSFRANPFGLFDTAGNVWEWCQDDFSPGYRQPPVSTQPRRFAQAEHHVIRGGAWDYSSMSMRSYARPKYRDSDRYWFIGFRLVRELEPEELSVLDR